MNYRRYAAYKESGVEWLGEVPAHWEVKRLRVLAEINPSKSEVAGLPPSTEVTFLPMELISEQGTLDLSQHRPLESVYQGFTYFRDNDVVTAKITPCFENGKGALACGLTNGIAFGTTELHVLRARQGYLPEYLWWVTRSPFFRELGALEMKGAAGQQRVPQSFIENFPQPTPPEAEQQAIAAFLDRETAQIDALIARQERLIAALQEKRQALISHAVTKGLNPAAPLKESGVEWLGEVPSHWEIGKVGHISTVVRGQTPRPAGDPEFFNGDYLPWITVGEVTKDNSIYLSETQAMLTELGAKRSRVFFEGTLVLSNSGATLGVPKILGLTGCMNDGNAAFLNVTENIELRYLYFYFLSITDYLRGYSQGMGQPNLNTTIIASLMLPKPALVEQQEIANYCEEQISKVDHLIIKAEALKTLLQERRAALVSAAVTGKIDVRG